MKKMECSHSKKKKSNIDRKGSLILVRNWDEFSRNHLKIRVDFENKPRKTEVSYTFMALDIFCVKPNLKENS